MLPAVRALTDFCDAGGRSIADASELTAAAHEHPAGTTVKVVYLRGGTELSTAVVLGSAMAG